MVHGNNSIFGKQSGCIVFFPSTLALTVDYKEDKRVRKGGFKKKLDYAEKLILCLRGIFSLKMWNKKMSTDAYF